MLVSGDGRGVDQAAIEAGEQRFMRTLVFPPVRDKGRTEFIRSAFARNQQIVDHSDFVVGFWDRKSNGTRDTLRKAQKVSKLSKVFDIKGKEISRKDLLEDLL